MFGCLGLRFVRVDIAGTGASWREFVALLRQVSLKVIEYHLDGGIVDGLSVEKIAPVARASVGLRRKLIGQENIREIRVYARTTRGRARDIEACRLAGGRL